VFTYTGSPYLLSEGKIALNFRPKRPRLATLAEALGQSNNIVFAKVGADVVGQERLLTALNAFGFNRDISFEFPLQQSRADVPLERYPLAQTAAGFGSVRLSPLHAAMIAASVANKGVMMQPYIIETVLDALGQTIFSSAPRTLMQTVPTEIAATLGEMMKNTVTQGTSRRSFLLRAKELVARISVAGKTGSLNGDDPPGRYEWFIGFAPADKPEIAVAALVVNNGSAKHLKGSDTAALMMREHFHL
jgi:cell division protein FtsI/penicillin-binding protein 2